MAPHGHASWPNAATIRVMLRLAYPKGRDDDVVRANERASRRTGITMIPIFVWDG